LRTGSLQYSTDTLNVLRSVALLSMFDNSLVHVWMHVQMAYLLLKTPTGCNGRNVTESLQKSEPVSDLRLVEESTACDKTSLRIVRLADALRGHEENLSQLLSEGHK
jgi:hypothetical protein